MKEKFGSEGNCPYICGVGLEDSGEGTGVVRLVENEIIGIKEEP